MAKKRAKKRLAKKRLKDVKKKAAPVKKKIKKDVAASKPVKKTEVKATAEIKQKAARLLCIDDEKVIRALLEKILTKAGYKIKLACSGEDALKTMKTEAVDLCVIDLKMPGMGGMAFLARMKELYPDTEAVILTGFGDIDTAVDAMKKGAFNFVAKPFKKDTFITIIERALERKLMKKDLEETRTAMREMEGEASKKIGELEGELAAIEVAKKALGEEFNAIRKSLLDKTGKRGDLEKKVMSLERVAGQIKGMEEKLVASEKEKREALKKAQKLEKELAAKVATNIQLGDRLEQAKTDLEDLKKGVAKEKKEPPEKEKEETKTTLSDIHQALADFRKEIEE